MHIQIPIALLFFRQANVVHTGDVFTTGGYPFIDTGTGGSIDGLIAAGTILLARTNAQTQVIPGHGPMASRTDIATRQQMLVIVRERIAAQLRKRRSLQQVIASRPTREFDAQYFKGGALPPDLWGPARLSRSGARDRHCCCQAPPDFGRHAAIQSLNR